MLGRRTTKRLLHYCNQKKCVVVDKFGDGDHLKLAEYFFRQINLQGTAARLAHAQVWLESSTINHVTEGEVESYFFHCDLEVNGEKYLLHQHFAKESLHRISKDLFLEKLVVEFKNIDEIINFKKKNIEMFY